MDLNPVVTGRADGQRADGLWTYDGHRPDVGANVRWGVTSNLTVNATVNPDFSQVEADATQFQIDPRQALFFPGEAAVLSRRHRVLLDAEQPRLQPPHRRATGGRQADGQAGRHDGGGALGGR